MEPKVIRLPEVVKRFGLPSRLAFTFDNGQATRVLTFSTQLYARHYRDGLRLKDYDLGSGLVTNVGVTAMANDFAWASPATAINTIKLQNFHATGTGTTAAAATDIVCQTLAAPTTTTAVTGTQTLVSAANLQKYQTVGLISYTTTLAITEWGLHDDATLSATTGSPFTATSATTGTGTGSVWTASTGTVRGQQQFIVYNATTDVYGVILSNTTNVLTIPAWYKKTDGTAGSTPGNTAFTLNPVMWDHKVFSAINVVNGDSIQFTYQLTIQSGG